MAPRIAENAVIDGSVALPNDICIGNFCVIGVDRGTATESDAFAIGKGAVIRGHTTIYNGNRIGAGFQTGHNVLVRELNEIGGDVSIGSSTEYSGTNTWE